LIILQKLKIEKVYLYDDPDREAFFFLLKTIPFPPPPSRYYYNKLSKKVLI